MVFKSFNVSVVKDNGLLRVLLNLDLVYKKYPSCPRCAKATFLHHDYQLYSNFRCGDKKCYHGFNVPKLVEIPNTSSSHIDLEKFTIKRMRHPFHIVFTALTLYFFDNSTLRKISQHLELVCEVKLFSCYDQ